jgi:hypothetical protein
VVNLDAWIDRLTPADFVVALLALLTAFAYLALLARAHARAKLLLALAGEARRRRLHQEDLLRTRGFAPRLEHYRRLESDVAARMAREGLRH